MTRPRVVIPVVLLGAALAIVSGKRTWLTGHLDDAVLGKGAVSATGTEVVTGLIALALVIAAAVLAAATSGAVIRRIALVVTAAAAELLAFLAVHAAGDGEAILGRLAATASGRTGTVAVNASATIWPWLVASGAALAGIAALAGLVGAGSWRGLSQRYDAPSDGQVAGGRGQRVVGVWDQLDQGIDPTLAEPDHHTNAATNAGANADTGTGLENDTEPDTATGSAPHQLGLAQSGQPPAPNPPREQQ